MSAVFWLSPVYLMVWQKIWRFRAGKNTLAAGLMREYFSRQDFFNVTFGEKPVTVLPQNCSYLRMERSFCEVLIFGRKLDSLLSESFFFRFLFQTSFTSTFISDRIIPWRQGLLSVMYRNIIKQLSVCLDCVNSWFWPGWIDFILMRRIKCFSI